jgi:hypothetical protein
MREEGRAGGGGRDNGLDIAERLLSLVGPEL